jgi:IS4 transposase
LFLVEVGSLSLRGEFKRRVEVEVELMVILGYAKFGFWFGAP